MACDGAETTGEESDTGSEELTFSDFISPSVDASGDFNCFAPVGQDETPTWLTQDVDPASVGSLLDLEGFVQDFQDDELQIHNATVQVWNSGDINSEANSVVISDDDGWAESEAPTCQPIAYRVSTDPGLGTTGQKTTYKAHQVYGMPEGDIIDAEFTSVSETTYLLIPTLFGITPDPGRSTIAGTAYDCTRDPSTSSDDDAGKVEGVQVIVLDQQGNIPDGVRVNYFVEKFPSSDQPHTSADGVWSAFNVPVGTYTVQMWGNVSGELKLLGETTLESKADSINVANIFAGYDSVKYPETCLTAAE